MDIVSHVTPFDSVEGGLERHHTATRSPEFVR